MTLHEYIRANSVAEIVRATLATAFAVAIIAGFVVIVIQHLAEMAA